MCQYNNIYQLKKKKKKRLRRKEKKKTFSHYSYSAVAHETRVTVATVILYFGTRQTDKKEGFTKIAP